MYEKQHSSGNVSDSQARDQFAQAMIDAMKSCRGNLAITYDRDNFQIDISGGTTLLLENVYREWSSAKASTTIRDIAHGWTQNWEMVASASLESMRPHLLPIVDILYRTLAPKPVKYAHASAPAYQLLGDHVTVEIARDLPDHIMFLDKAQLLKLSISFEEAIAVAKENLRRVSTKALIRRPSGLMISPWQDNYDSARLTILDELVPGALHDDLVAMIPHRDCLLVAPANNEPALAEMATIAKLRRQGPRFLSGIPLLRSGGTWKTFIPPECSSVYSPFRELRLRSLASHYVHQDKNRELLAYCQDVDVIASVFIGETCIDEFTLAFWMRDYVTLLPEVTYVVFTNPAAGDQERVVYGNVLWERVHQVMGYRMQPLGTYPERWRVEAFPSPAEMKEMGL